MLNMFRTLLHPSTGDYDFSIVTIHWPCVLVSMCVGVSLWLVWGSIRVTGCVWACYTDIVEPCRPQMTVLRMRIECWISKTTDAHSEHAIVIALLPQQWLHERAAVWYVHRLSCRSCPEGPAAPWKEQVRPKLEPANLWDACPNGTWKDFLVTWHSLLSEFCFISFVRPVSLCCEVYAYLYTHLTVYRLYMCYRCYQITLRWNIFRQVGSNAKFWLDVYRWDTRLAVTGRIRVIGQSSF